MRETCTRVVAATLMTGAIAGVVALAAHVGTPTGPGRPIAAPPSTLQRTVPLTERSAPTARPSTAQPTTATTIRVQPPPHSATVRQVLAKDRGHRPAPKRQLAATDTRPATPVPVQPGGHGHGRYRQED